MNNILIINDSNFKNFRYGRKVIDRELINHKEVDFFGLEFNNDLAKEYSKLYNTTYKVINNIKLINTTFIFKDKTNTTFDDYINLLRNNNNIKVIITEYSTSDSINEEGIYLNSNNKFVFNFKSDNPNDILSLRYNTDETLLTKNANGLISHYTYVLNRKVDYYDRRDLIYYIKNKFEKLNPKIYHKMIDNAVGSLMKYHKFNLDDIDVIVIPFSSSDLNFHIATEIKRKLPKAHFNDYAFYKETVENIELDYDLLKEKNISKERILDIKNQIQNATINGIFSIKKINTSDREFVINFLKIDNNQKDMIRKIINGNVLVVDDMTTKGTTFKEINRILDTYNPKSIIYYSMIG